ncbi:MAG: LuxR C-terminal-related transcriptional regulator [Pseudomonadota bacterium]|nr:LuxR C-terminal-related transcriptional regulator [Pseudomonadota bacterium]
MGKTHQPTESKYRSAASLQSGKVHRDSIFERAFAAGAPPIVFLQAPAGHGKSVTLLQIQESCAASGVRCGWLNLDESDNDHRRHAINLRGLLSRVLNMSPDAFAARSTSAGAGERLRSRSDWLIEELDNAREPVALFVDEFEVLADRNVLSFWKDFLTRAPAHVRIFIAARGIPDIGLPRLLVSERAMVLPAEVLRFSRAEVEQFFLINGEARLQPEEVDELHHVTEGWPGAIQLMRLHLSRQSPGELIGRLKHHQPRQLADYLTDCVIEGLSSDLRNFLRRSCVLNRLGAQVCNLLSGRSDSVRVLSLMEKQGLFVNAIDDSGEWFRYHSLLASYLRERLLSEDPETFRRLNREACEWFFSESMYEDAIHHAVVANELSRAADILEVWGGLLVSDGQLATVDRWSECIPVPEIASRPELKRRVAWAYLFMGRLDKFKAISETSVAQKGEYNGPGDGPFWISRGPAYLSADNLVDAVRCSKELPDPTADMDVFTSFEMAAACNLKSFCGLMTGRLDEVDAAVCSADQYHRQSRAHFSEGYTACLRGLAQMLKGDTEGAIATLEEGLAIQRRDLYSAYATPPVAASYIWALYETDQLEATAEAASVYSETVHRCTTPDFLATGIMAMARTYAAIGEQEQARNLLLAAEMHAKRNNWPRLVRYYAQIRSDIRAGRASGRSTVDAVEWSVELVPICEVAYGVRAQHIHALIQKKAFVAAADAIQQLRAQRPDDVWTEAQLLFAKVHLLDARGLETAALRELSKALELTGRHGFRRLAIERVERHRRLMERLLEKMPPGNEFYDRARDLAERIWGAQALPEDSPACAFDPAQLTLREREVAQCLRQRMSTREIARIAHVSENTVKFHLKNIYTKLGVGSRIEACRQLQRVDFGTTA